MAAPSKWTVEWYATATGDKPLRPPRSESLGGGLFELRAHPRPVRIFYVFQPGRRIIVLDGMVKKKDRIPADVLKRMRGYQRDVESRPVR